MSLTGLEVFDETLHKTNAWLKETEGVLGPERRRAYQALRAVLHCLRDRLTVDEAANSATSSRCWSAASITRPGIRPESRKRSARAEEFLARIGARFPKAKAIDPEDAARAVFQVLENHVSAGEIRDVMQSLPEEIRTLWPRPQSAA